MPHTFLSHSYERASERETRSEFGVAMRIDKRRRPSRSALNLQLKGDCQSCRCVQALTKASRNSWDRLIEQSRSAYHHHTDTSLSIRHIEMALCSRALCVLASPFERIELQLCSRSLTHIKFNLVSLFDQAKTQSFDSMQHVQFCCLS